MQFSIKSCKYQGSTSLDVGYFLRNLITQAYFAILNGNIHNESAITNAIRDCVSMAQAEKPVNRKFSFLERKQNPYDSYEEYLVKSPMNRYRILVFVLSVIGAFLSGCADKNKATSKHASVAASAVSAPPVKLQRMFKDISMNAIVFMTQAPGDEQYWYVVEKSGRVLRIENRSDKNDDVSQASVFIDITDRVDASPNEAGLLGMAFHPQYQTNGYVYLSYTGDDGGLVSYISRFKSLDNGETLSPQSEKRLIKVEQPYSNHNGGNILFGRDGFLYIGLGDGGSGGDPKGHGQNTQTLLGAMLRIDVDNGDPYGIPPSNPFASNKQGKPEIYLWGLRNPWRWSFDRETAQLWVADVGQNSWEEVNVVTGPGNLGWNGKEGTHCYTSARCEDPSYIDPVIEYDHDEGCSITGGYVYRGTRISDLKGIYMYGDYCSGSVWGAKDQGGGNFQSFKLLDTGLNIASFAEGNDGEVYVIHLPGEIYRIIAK